METTQLETGSVISCPLCRDGMVEERASDYDECPRECLGDIGWAACEVCGCSGLLALPLTDDQDGALDQDAAGFLFGFGDDAAPAISTSEAA